MLPASNNLSAETYGLRKAFNPFPGKPEVELRINFDIFSGDVYYVTNSLSERVLQIQVATFEIC